MATPIIAAYDPLREDRAPVELALLFGELTGTPVLAGAVHSAAFIDGWMEPLQPDPELFAAADRAVELLRADTGVQCRSLVDVSVPHALHDLARKQGSGLIVVGSTKRGRVGRVLPGSTAERVLHGAECAVALAPNGYRRDSIETLAVGFIDTLEGRAALTAAHALALRAGARLRAIAVRHVSSRPGPLEDAIAHAVAALPPGVDVETEVHADDPVDVLLGVTEHVDMLVCGSRGYGPLRSILLGGVSRRLVEGAHCPVLVLPRGIERPLGDLVGPANATAAR